jgi:hypothetical protein
MISNKNIPLKFIINPILLFSDIYQEFSKKSQKRKEQRASDNSEPEEVYFMDAAIRIMKTQKQLLIYGYDEVFMNNVAIQRELTNAAKGHDYFRPNSRVVISAIIPDSVNCEPLEKLASEQDNFVSITRTSKKLTKGYMVFDNWGVGAWNSKIKTSYIPERNKGVIGRTVIPDNRSAIEYERDFKTHIEKLQN